MDSLNEIRSFGERFRNILYLVVSVAIGYLILVKFLSILDAESIGLNWLANNPNNAFVIIFVLWLFLILAVDLIIDLIYSKRRKYAYLAKTSTDSRPKTVTITQVQEEKTVPTERLANLICDIKEAQSPGPKKRPYFWGKKDKTNIKSRSQEDKQIRIFEKGIKREIGEGETPQKEAPGKPETKPFEPAKKILRKKAKGITPRTRIVEEPKQIREIQEPADKEAIGIKKRRPKTVTITQVQKTLGKFYQRARSEEKPFSGEGLANLISDIKEAQVSGSKKTKWSHFWGKEDKTNITSRITSKSLEDKQKRIVKREVGEKKRELKGGTIKKEAPEIGKTAKGKTARTKIFEELKQIREPADNIQSTDMAAISVKRGSRFREAFDDEHYVSVIDFTPSISHKETMIRIEKLKATSQLVEEIPPNIIFENFNIWVNIPEENIGKPGIVFRVDKSWVTENNLREIQLYKYMDHEWVLQGPAEKLDEDGGYFYFQTLLKGLSGSYAIVGI